MSLEKLRQEWWKDHIHRQQAYCANEVNIGPSGACRTDGCPHCSHLKEFNYDMHAYKLHLRRVQKLV